MTSPQRPLAASGASIDLTRLFNPEGIAVIGASEDPKRTGGQPVFGLKNYGYAGAVYPVNPGHAAIQGLTAYPDVTALPCPCDMAIIALPADKVAGVIEQCGSAKIPFAIILSAGFADSGRDDLQRELQHAIRASGVRVVGPNCTGMLNLRDNVFSGFGAGFRNPKLRRGPVAMVTQSGGFGYSLIAFAESEGVGFSHMISTGNEIDLSTLDMLEHLLEDDGVEIIACFMEGVNDGRRLRRIGARALEYGKPIVVWKVGNTARGRAAALSHTANLTSTYAMYKAAFDEGGFIEMADSYDLIDVSRAFQRRRFPSGNRVGIVTTSGGAGILLTDRSEEQGLAVATIGDETVRALKELGGTFSAVDNPVDLSARLAGDPVAFNAATSLLLDDPNIDMAIIRSFAGTAADKWAEGLVELLNMQAKPVVVALSGLAANSSAAVDILARNGIPWYPTPGRAVRGASTLSAFAAKMVRLGARTPAVDDHALAAPLPAGAQTLSERQSKRIFEAAGIAVVKELALTEAAVQALDHMALTFPVVVKIDSADIPHKTEAGGVRKGLTSLDAVKAAAIDVVQSARRHAPQARIDGVLVQETAQGLELIVGGVNDPVFGPYVVVGMGGVLSEILQDTAMRFAPVDASGALAMLASLKSRSLFAGYRGANAYALEGVADVIVRVSRLMSGSAERIAELDINPLFVRPDGAAVAADGLIALK